MIYSFVDEHYENAIAGTKTARHQAALRRQFDLRENVQADVWLRYVGERKPSANAGAKPQSVDPYTTLDMRLAWQPMKTLELSLVGQNLIHSQHVQFRTNILDVIPTQISRDVYLQLLWHFQ